MSKLNILLAIAKMNLLHSHKIAFDGVDNIKNWDKEFSFGISVEDNDRSILAKVRTFEFKTGNPSRDDMWDASCARCGFDYYPGVKFQDLFSGKEISIEKFRELWQNVKEKFSKWSWDGAPEFKDWSVFDAQPIENAQLQYSYLFL
jgi:hypothetical protein